MKSRGGFEDNSAHFSKDCIWMIHDGVIRGLFLCQFMGYRSCRVVRFYPSKRGLKMPQHVRPTESHGVSYSGIWCGICISSWRSAAAPPVVRVPSESRSSPPFFFVNLASNHNSLFSLVSFIFMCSHTAKRQSRFVFSSLLSNATCQ